MATPNIPVSTTNDIESYHFTVRSTGLTGELKIRGLDETPQALLYPTCNAANLLAANSAQTAQEHSVKRADLTLLGTDLSAFAYLIFFKGFMQPINLFIAAVVNK